MTLLHLTAASASPPRNRPRRCPRCHVVDRARGDGGGRPWPRRGVPSASGCIGRAAPPWSAGFGGELAAEGDCGEIGFRRWWCRYHGGFAAGALRSVMRERNKSMAWRRGVDGRGVRAEWGCGTEPVSLAGNAEPFPGQFRTMEARHRP
ncbi:uncharacterized protein [Oryza sativa Japonica Group]|uniref:uncharacterized protein n=1 Tax=Oryza sativa subsp. japonica TaxID=39947 RepID=UPI00339CA22F